MIIVYRVQDAQGRGPYRPGVQLRWCDGDHDARNPVSWEDFPAFLGKPLRLRAERDAFGSGFRTLEGLTAWFNAAERERLLRLHYRVVRMEVDEVMYESPRQLIFWRSRPLREATTNVPWRKLR